MAKRAAVAGYFLFSAGVKSAYFVLITLALSIIVEQLAVSQSEITGGYNGLLVDRMTLGLGPLGEIPPTGDVASYYAGYRRGSGHQFCAEGADAVVFRQGSRRDPRE